MIRDSVYYYLYSLSLHCDYYCDYYYYYYYYYYDYDYYYYYYCYSVTDLVCDLVPLPSSTNEPQSLGPLTSSNRGGSPITFSVFKFSGRSYLMGDGKVLDRRRKDYDVLYYHLLRLRLLPWVIPQAHPRDRGKSGSHALLGPFLLSIGGRNGRKPVRMARGAVVARLRTARIISKRRKWKYQLVVMELVGGRVVAVVVVVVVVVVIVVQWQQRRVQTTRCSSETICHETPFCGHMRQ